MRLTRRKPRHGPKVKIDDSLPPYERPNMSEMDNVALEKARRVYYQTIVYDVCNSLDRIFSKRPTAGIVCGTIEGPSRQVQEHLKIVEQRCAEWAKQQAAQQPGEQPKEKTMKCETTIVWQDRLVKILDEHTWAMSMVGVHYNWDYDGNGLDPKKIAVAGCIKGPDDDLVAIKEFFAIDENRLLFVGHDDDAFWLLTGNPCDGGTIRRLVPHTPQHHVDVAGDKTGLAGKPG